ncbi:MAG: YidH family protein [Vibrio sp.]
MIKSGQWRKRGKAPDYRFSLANERTFLAWVRTALALLAGAVAIDQLTPNLAPPMYREIISAVLSLFSGIVAFYAYRRWRDNERSMRFNRELHYTRFLSVISFGILALALGFIVILAL